MPQMGWLPVDASARQRYLPQRTSEQMAAALAGHRIVLVGDSMVRQIFTRLVCAMRQRSVCIEPLSEHSLQAYQFRRTVPKAGGVEAATNAGGSEYATDHYLFDAGVNIRSDDGAVDAVVNDEVLNLRGFEILFVWNRVSVAQALATLIRTLRPTVIIGGLFYWKPDCRERLYQAPHVCPACGGINASRAGLCATLAWESDTVLRSAAAAVAQAVTEPKRTLGRTEKVVWLTSPARPLDVIQPRSKFVANADFYERRNARMRRWLDEVMRAAREKGALTEFLTLDLAAMANSSTLPSSSSRVAQVFARNAEDHTHFQCSWTGRPPQPIQHQSVRFKAPLQLQGGGTEVVCQDAFNYAVVQRIISLIASSYSTK